MLSQSFVRYLHRARDGGLLSIFAPWEDLSPHWVIQEGANQAIGLRNQSLYVPPQIVIILSLSPHAVHAYLKGLQQNDLKNIRR